ncbi:MAG: DUF2723 domain-containing protein [Bacteroidales bacterium]|nr:DUF2723 domain-containing protein [Bacteroidales bacterium]
MQKIKIDSKKATQINWEKQTNENALIYISAGLSFLCSLLVYMLTLAPSVTLEDSGELITAAYRLGVAHEPGYPLFTMLGKAFSWLPIGSIAYRLNFMSAFFSALAAALICLTAIQLIEHTFKKGIRISKNGNSISFLKYAVGFAAAMFYTLSFEVWEQSVITEVYSLHSFLLSIFLLLFVLWYRREEKNQKKRLFYLMCLVIGISLTNHSTSLLLIPVLGIYLAIFHIKFIFNIKTILTGILFGLIGLLPLLYLPIASSFDPVLDWGNPENLSNFFRTISRHQYIEFEQTSEKFIAGLSYYFIQALPSQWFPVVLVLLLPAFIVLYRYNRKFLYFSIIFLLFYIPVTTYLTDFDVTGKDFRAELYRLLVSVFYIPSYLFFSILLGLGLFFLGTLIKNNRLVNALSIVTIILPIALSAGNHRKVNMHNFRYADIYIENLFKAVPRDAVVFTQIDYYYFPLMYYQDVLGERTDITVLDQPLLKRSWYIEMLKNHRPQIFQRSQGAFDEFLAAVEPFEAGNPYNGAFIEKNYMAMINSVIDDAIEDGREVYFTYVPQKEIQRDYYLESVIGALKVNSTGVPAAVDYSEFSLDAFQYLPTDSPLLVRYLSQYYGEWIFSRAMLEESSGNFAVASLLYQECLKFSMVNERIISYTKEKLKSLNQ